MQPYSGRKSTHSGQLERWLGVEMIADLTQNMKGWYGPPIAVHGVPGAVWATADGDFIGPIEAGYEAGPLDRAQDILKRHARREQVRLSNKANRRKRR